MTDLSTRSAPIEAFTPFARHMHWTLAALIAVVFLIGLTVDAFPKSWDPTLVAIHKDLGLLALLLALARVLYRLGHAPPAPLPDTPLRLAMARLVQGLLYVLMFVTPALGIIYAMRRGQGFDFGLFSIPPFMTGDRAAARPWRTYHEYAAWAMIALALGHGAMALWHHFVKGDGVLRRMWPGPR